MKTLLLSTYELGHQPFNLASPAAHLLQAGHDVHCLDLAVQKIEFTHVRNAEFIAISTPMHTAMRLALPLARRVRAVNPNAHICFYGLYAGLHSEYLLENVADSAIGGEYEEAMVALVNDLAQKHLRGGTQFPRQKFLLPARHLLPALKHYAHLLIAGERRLAGSVEASRGCAHHCRHCPITPVYNGRVRIVQEGVVLADVAQLVAFGARHITFGDPDFLNAVKHSLRLVRELHARWPELTFDFTAKVEHILQYENLFPELARLGCVFVVSAVECLNEEVLKILAKGHARAGVERAFEITTAAGIFLRPSLMPFTPWTSLEDFLALLDFVQERKLLTHFDPIQFSIRLLLPPGSALLSLPETQKHLCGFDEGKFTFMWQHPDPRMDELQTRIATRVEEAGKNGEDVYATFASIRALSYRMAGQEVHARAPLPPMPDLHPPRLTEHWFC